ncbi:hypothetical protein EDF67_1182 [Sphingobacterium sp. JUb78]|nr:hypothetical protein [Sphingobacterium kitahiroshimense]TCR00134.1 hypothetical protein EDF67_1182 [Sphingobacterium sp. JUb78]
MYGISIVQLFSFVETAKPIIIDCAFTCHSIIQSVPYTAQNLHLYTPILYKLLRIISATFRR